MLSKQVFILIGLLGVSLSLGNRAQSIDFDRDIRPILSTHCLTCHNTYRAEAGLSLDVVEAARLGGESGNPVLGGTRETNEILRRVTSKDPSQRMPLEADALSLGEIELLTRWVDQGTPWPEAVTASMKPNRGSISLFLGRWIRPYLVWYASLLVGVIVVERLKARLRSRSDNKDTVWLSKVGAPTYVAAGLCMALGTSIHQLQLVEARLGAVKAERYTSAYAPSSITELFGDPPAPIRPSHEARIGGTYYRGNNERKAELYNNGHYRTATLELSLINEQGETLVHGSDVTSDLSIRLLIQRAPQATPLLFSDDIMSGLLLTTGYHPGGVSIASGQAATFKSIASKDTWEAIIPIELDEQAGSGLIYLYRGDRDEDGYIKTTGMPQIGIVYELELVNGRIAAGSELWMDAIYFPENILPPAPEGMVPWNEWLDYRPIPVIKGKPTTDHALLGVTFPDGAEPSGQESTGR